MYRKNQPVYGNETWHTDRVLKPHVQRHTNVIPISFAAPGGAFDPTGVGTFCDFQQMHRCISETVQDRVIVILFINRKSYMGFPLVT